MRGLYLTYRFFINMIAISAGSFCLIKGIVCSAVQLHEIVSILWSKSNPGTYGKMPALQFFNFQSSDFVLKFFYPAFHILSGTNVMEKHHKFISTDTSHNIQISKLYLKKGSEFL